MQGEQGQSLVWEDPTRSEQPSPWATTTGACEPGTCAPQQKKPPQWEEKSSHHTAASQLPEINNFFLSSMVIVSRA